MVLTRHLPARYLLLIVTVSEGAADTFCTLADFAMLSHDEALGPFSCHAPQRPCICSANKAWFASRALGFLAKRPANEESKSTSSVWTSSMSTFLVEETGCLMEELELYTALSNKKQAPVNCWLWVNTHLVACLVCFTFLSASYCSVQLLIRDHQLPPRALVPKTRLGKNNLL